MRKALVTREPTFRYMWAICPIVTPRFSDIIIVLSGDVSISGFLIALVILVNFLPRNICDGSSSITEYLN